MEQKIQDYGNDGSAIFRTGVHSYEVRTSHGTGSGATVAEALKDLADNQVKSAATLTVTVDSVDDIEQIIPVEQKPKKKRKSSKKKKQTD